MIYKLKTPLYRVTIELSFDMQEAYDRYGLGKPDPNYDGEVSFITNLDGMTHISIIIPYETYSANVLAHESVHAAWRVLDLVGIKATSDNDEPLAYLVGWIAGEVNNKFAKEVKKVAAKNKLIEEANAMANKNETKKKGKK